MTTHFVAGALTSVRRPGRPYKLVGRQQGVSVYIALIALVVLSLASVALLRSVDTGSLVVGNVALKKSATVVADQAAEAAIAWLGDNISGNDLFDDIPDSGYYATSQEALDPLGTGTDETRVLVDWDGNECADQGSACLQIVTPVDTADVNGYTASYVILRLCAASGDPNAIGNSCLLPAASVTTSAKRGSLDYSDYVRFAGQSGPYFRIIVRARGPRNTTSFTETIVHF